VENDGVDLDGDGVVDNKLGRGLVILSESLDLDLNFDLSRRIYNAELIVVGRTVTGSFPTSSVVLAQILEGQLSGTADYLKFDGTDVLQVGPTTNVGTTYMCGKIASGNPTVGPGEMEVPVPLPGNVSKVVLEQAMMFQGTISETGWTGVYVAGGLPKSEIQGVIVPAVTTLLNDVLASYPPANPTYKAVLNVFDSDCLSTVEGCESVQNGQGQCLDDGTITETEVRCNALFAGLVDPDLDIDHDGKSDLLSFGYKVEKAVPITLLLQ